MTESKSKAARIAQRKGKTERKAARRKLAYTQKKGKTSKW